VPNTIFRRRARNLAERRRRWRTLWRFNFWNTSPRPGCVSVAAQEAWGQERRDCRGRRLVRRRAHPPLLAATAEYHVVVGGLRRFHRISDRRRRPSTNWWRSRPGGWQVWSCAPTAVVVQCPAVQAGNVLRLTFATDALGTHRGAGRRKLKESYRQYEAGSTDPGTVGTNPSRDELNGSRGRLCESNRRTTACQLARRDGRS
jgi:hypothetical protein